MTLSPLVIAAPSALIRILVPHGHGTAYVHGTLTNPAACAEYVLHTRKGQHLSLLMQKGGQNVIMLYFPSGQQDSAPGGISDTLPRTGNDCITITEHQMAEAWDGPFVPRVILSRVSQSRPR